ncbi:DUF6233 domain-containing protein [Streptomyces sp. NPDC058686]|uniref:DUF6233 domain-containing protein n=1 Tax=Streptomyces sp. NPDC058686 TaxID=3346599 RepID=UPI00366148AE
MSRLSYGERIERHRAVVAWLKYQLPQEEETIRKLEDKQAEEDHRRQVAHIESRFKIERPMTEDEPDRLHRGGCRRGGEPLHYYTAQEVAMVLRGALSVAACEVCNPLPGLNIRVPTAGSEDWA